MHTYIFVTYNNKLMSNNNKMFTRICLFSYISLACAGYIATNTQVYTIRVGDTNVNLTKEVFPIPANCLNCDLNLAFLNLHENENTSVVAVRSYLYQHGGSLVKFAKGNTRYVTFKIGQDSFTADPNRIFTPEGVKSTLQANGKYSDEAALQVQNLASQILSIYDFASQTTVLALHNNGGSYGASSYLPGGPYANDAEKVNIESGSNPSDFYYVVDPVMYDTIVAKKYNVVLQNNDTVTNDGSLSYYCGLQNTAYVNFEAQSEYTSYGKQTVIQLDMIYAIHDILSEFSKK
jgi:hypothetical protein